MAHALIAIQRAARTFAAAVAAVSLVACGGGDDNPNSSSSGGKLTISAATPSAHNGDIDVDTAVVKGNNARAADGFSSLPYCEIFFEDARSSNSTRYAVQVYFRQGDKAVLHASIVGGNPPSYVVFHNNSGNPIGGITVDTAARRLTFTAKVLNGSGGEAGTVNGTVGFPANSGTPACGA